MKNLIVLLIFTAFNFSLSSQVNLVANGGFEQYSNCPTFGAQWNACTGWNNVNMNTGVGPWGTPDYFNTCGSSGVIPPNTFAGVCPPHLGNAMMALVLYNVPYPEYREYLSTQLSCSMTPGNTYTVSFWLSNGTTPISPWTIKNIGIHFSTSPLNQSGWGLINAVPQCEITSNITSTVWTQYTFTVTPTANWSYLTIGAFRSDASNQPTQSFTNIGGNPSAYANYFVDDISVLSSTGNASVNVSSSATSTLICPGQTVGLVASGANSYTWSTGATGSSISVSPSVTTTFSVNTNSGSSCVQNISSLITISVSPTTNMYINGPLSVCAGSSATIFATGANSYTWSTGAVSPSIVISPSVSFNYTVTGTSNSCLTSSALVSFINVLPKPVITISGIHNVCGGQTLILTANGASSYAWNGGLSSYYGTIAVTPTTQTTYTVVGTTVSTGCTGTASAVINVTPSPVLNISASPTICPGQSATLAVSGASIYLWSTNLSGSLITVSPSVTTTYSVAGSNTTACQSNTNVTVVVHPPVNLQVSGSGSLCAGNPATLSVTGANSYSWNNVAGSPVFTVIPTATAVYTVVGINNQSHCLGKATATLTVRECLGLDKTINNNLEWNVFPNPFVNELVLVQNGEHGILNIELISSLGQVVHSSRLPANEKQKILDLSNLSGGVYLLRVSDSSGISTKTIIKQN